MAPASTSSSRSNSKKTSSSKGHPGNRSKHKTDLQVSSRTNISSLGNKGTAPAVTPGATSKIRSGSKTVSSKEGSHAPSANLPTSVEIENAPEEEEETSVGMDSKIIPNSATFAFHQLQRLSQTNFYKDLLPLKRFIKEQFFPKVSFIGIYFVS